MKKVVVFLCVFSYIFPVFIKYLPLPFDRILQIAGMVVLLLLSRYQRFNLISRKILFIATINIPLVVLAFLAMLNGPTSSDSYLLKQTLDIYFFLLSAFLIVLLLIERYGDSFSIVKVFDIITYAFIFQSLISIVFFISPTLFNMYLSVLKEEVNHGLFLRTDLLTKRFIGWGAAFFSGVVKYGISFLILMVLPYCKESTFYGRQFKYICALSLITVAGAMTGRFFFLAIGLGAILSVVVDRRNLIRIMYRGVPLLLVFLLSFYALGQQFLGAERFEIVFNFVFELFLTYLDTGELSTTSSEATLSMYVFPDTVSTWLIGDGAMFERDGSYYMRSDVGYVRLLFYFGSIATLIYFIIQFYFYRTLVASTDQKVIKKAFLFMFFWVCIFHAKGLVSVNEYVALFLISLAAENKIRRQRKNRAL